MHIATCLCCNLFRWLGGDLPIYAFQGGKLGPWMIKIYCFLSRLFLFVSVRWNITLLEAVTATKGQTCKKTLENNTEFT